MTLIISISNANSLTSYICVDNRRKVTKCTFRNALIRAHIDVHVQSDILEAYRRNYVDPKMTPSLVTRLLISFCAILSRGSKLVLKSVCRWLLFLDE
mmetsp:Transcript_21278/g.40706  ORF Transcript_21278/g.40706 Transcript_21278/m.40706 type:complete len:97 (-) Transcript_21278:1147-1437(-)